MSSPIVIANYNPQWPILYEEEKRRILDAIAQTVVAIEHIGSTSVPGLGAKPIIDIMVAVLSLADAQICIEPLQNLGYEYVPEFEEFIPERRYFRKWFQEERTHQIHMVELKSEFWQRHLLFRDYLRTHPQVAQEYYELKKELVARHGDDRDAYTDAKTLFIESVVAKASIPS